jgi:hypothetical protein
MREFNDVLEEDVADRLYALTGQIGHAILERAAGGDDSVITERRLYMDVLGRTVGGQVDRLEPSTVVDFKYTSLWVSIFGVKPEWEAQLNLLAHLCRANSLPVSGLQVHAIFRDWQKSKAKFDREYPQLPAQVFDVRLWTPEEAQSFLEERVALHVRAMERGEVPPCTPEERWEQPAQYAVTKPGRKRALRVLKTEAEAEEWIQRCSYAGERLHIQHRPGVNRRCEDWCVCLPVCDQGQKLVNGERSDKEESRRP